MMDETLATELARDLRGIYRDDPSRAEASIERYLREKLPEVSPPQQETLLREIAGFFRHTPAGPPLPAGGNDEEVARLFSLLLGRRVATADLSCGEVAEKLALSLNTLFDTVNQIVAVISRTLLGKRDELETIRQIIGADLQGEGDVGTLQSYLDQIQEAFLVAHQAFKQAAGTKMNDVLTELDPDRIAKQVEGGLKFGPLRKAEMFDIYRERFGVCKGWFQSGRFTEDLLREFEKICQKTYKIKTKDDGAI